MLTKAVVLNPDGSVFYRQEHEWPVLSPPMEQVLQDGLAKQKKFLDDLKANQRKDPDAIYSATMSATGQPDVSYDAFTYDMFQKAAHAWNQMLEAVFREGEKHLRGT